MAWVVQRQTEDDNTIFEVFVYDHYLHVSGHLDDEIRIKPSELADALNSEMWECEGYELVKIQRNEEASPYDAHIYICRPRRDYLSTYDLKLHADAVLRELKEQKKY